MALRYYRFLAIKFKQNALLCDFSEYSEQQLIDCSPSEGCLEGWHYYAWAYLAKFGGQATSDSYPYTGVDGKCKYPKTGVKGAELSSQYEENYYSYGYYINIAARDTTTMMDLLSKKRLIGISIAVVDSFYSYKYVKKHSGFLLLERLCHFS